MCGHSLQHAAAIEMCDGASQSIGDDANALSVISNGVLSMQEVGKGIPGYTFGTQQYLRLQSPYGSSIN